MKLGKELMLFSIVSIVFLAGCARGPSAPVGNGLVIKSFSPEFSSVDSGAPVSFLLTVQNLGEVKATAVKAQLFGLSTDWILTPPLGSVQPLTPSSLAAPDPLSGLQGEETTQEWTATTPSKVTDVNYDASLRVYYGYTTAAGGLVRFVSSTYQRSLTQQGQQLAQPIGVISSTSSGGPLLITILARTPVVSATGDSTGRVQIEIQNVGSGRVYDLDSGKSEPEIVLDRIKEIKIGGVGDGKCAGVDDSTGIVTLSGLNAQKLLTGKSRTINCEIKTGDVITQNFKNVELKIDITYNYFVDSATSITVLKQFQ